MIESGEGEFAYFERAEIRHVGDELEQSSRSSSRPVPFLPFEDGDVHRERSDQCSRPLRHRFGELLPVLNYDVSHQYFSRWFAPVIGDDGEIAVDFAASRERRIERDLGEDVVHNFDRQTCRDDSGSSRLGVSFLRFVRRQVMMTIVAERAGRGKRQLVGKLDKVEKSSPSPLECASDPQRYTQVLAFRRAKFAAVSSEIRESEVGVEAKMQTQKKTGSATSLSRKARSHD